MMNKPILRSEICMYSISNVDQLRSEFIYNFQLRKRKYPRKTTFKIFSFFSDYVVNVVSQSLQILQIRVLHVSGLKWILLLTFPNKWSSIFVDFAKGM